MHTPVPHKYGSKNSGETITQWIHENKESVKGVRNMLQQMRGEKVSDYATVMVAVRSINNLVSANH